MTSLTVAVMARDAELRLPMLLAEAQGYADEIVVAVDAASTDATWAVAQSGADRVFRFRHDGPASPARMACIERARCDWTLFLDDDEGMDEGFPPLRDELLGSAGTTHWWLPRKWLDRADPPGFLHADPWWPNLCLRLMRSDPTRVWKPTSVHSGLRVMGRGDHESRTAILHYERLDRSAADRAAKVAHYRARGQTREEDRFYAATTTGHAVLPVLPPPLRRAGATPIPRAAIVVETAVEDLDLRPRVPGWAAEIAVDMPHTATGGEVLFATVTARNTGILRWDTPVRGGWPDLAVTYRLRDAAGALLPDTAWRTVIGRDVVPGEQVQILCRIVAPESAGSYTLDWQLVSEHEHWFEDLGSAPASRPLRVR